MTAWQVVLGWVLVAVQVAACAVAGHGLCRRLAPSWRGPWAALAAAVAALTVLVGVGQILGSVGLLRRWVLPVALVAVAALVRLRGSAEGADHVPAPRTSPQPPAVHIAAVVAAAAIAASWVERVVAVYRRGMTDGDSLMYHLVFAARFVQSGWTTGADAVGPDAWVAFYPANVELLEAVLIVPFGDDVLVPLMNLGWLALALLASWCVGAEAGQGPLGLVVGALATSVPVLVATQAGTARVDIAVIALMLAAVALLLHSPRSTGSCALAGLAVGLAIGSKFAVLPLAGLLLVGAAVVLARREGARAVLAWSGAAAIGGYWYVRNWVIAGSPVPAIELRVFGIGFAPLPADRLELLEGSSIVENMDRRGFWANVARPVAEHVFATPVITVAVALTAAFVVVRVATQRPLGLRHAVLVAAIGGCLAYPFAPYSAPLLDADTSSPFAVLIVALNVRYLLPPLVLILCLLPSALDGLGRMADVTAVAASVVVVYLWADNMGFDVEGSVTASDSLAAVALVAVALVAAAATAAVGRAGDARSPAIHGALGVVGAVAVTSVALTAWVAAGRSGVRRHDELPAGHAELWEAANGVSADNVALVDDWVQYPLMGDNLDRDVDYVGLPRDRGVSQPPRTCDELDAALAAGAYDLVVVQRPILSGPGAQDYIDCLRGGAGAELVLENQAGALFLLRSSGARGVAEAAND